MTKLTKSQRARLLSPETKALVEALSSDELLALHDLTHELMEARHKWPLGSNSADRDGRLLSWLVAQSRPCWGGHIMLGDPIPSDLRAFLERGLIERQGNGYVITEAGRVRAAEWRRA